MVIQQRQVRAEVALFWGGEVREGGGVVQEVEGVFVDLGGVVSCGLARECRCRRKGEGVLAFAIRARK